mgnify:CR=1 FL=1
MLLSASRETPFPSAPSPTTATTELLELCSELRSNIISVVSKNGGHLAPNLGVIELTVALHRVFNSPEDKIVWDVGHQSYSHKILTGRFKRFPTINLSQKMSVSNCFRRK